LVRESVSWWIAVNWDDELPLLTWRSMLAESGWGCPTWPLEWFGRDLSRGSEAIVLEEFQAAGAVGAATGTGMMLAAPTLLAHGSDEIKGRLLKRIITGEDKWCQLFSEPGSGSDLAGVTTTAILDGDHWVVNGQKVWNSGAHHAANGMLLARTDWDVPKHQGLTYFAIRMDQPGVEVRPLRQMNGYATFNEVFMSDAVVSTSDVVGEVGNGWNIAQTTLAHERVAATGRGPSLPKHGGSTVVAARAEAREYFSTYRWYPQRAGRPDLVKSHLRTAGKTKDPVLRQEVVKLISMQRIAGWTQQRAKAARAQGRKPGPEGSLTKLMNSRIAQHASKVHSQIAGPAGCLVGTEGALGGLVAEVILSVPAASIAGGTDEIQRNIIGERVLGLARELSVDSDGPFREVRLNRGSSAGLAT
jgi:alkylation response protein AidB-like acyl-CoA dehydrogenase